MRMCIIMKPPHVDRSNMSNNTPVEHLFIGIFPRSFVCWHFFRCRIQMTFRIVICAAAFIYFIVYAPFCATANPFFVHNFYYFADANSVTLCYLLRCEIANWFFMFFHFFLLFAQEYYKKLATSTTQIESHLSNKLAEFLNAEIVLNTITDAEASMERWFRTTFLYARTAKRKPTNQANADLKSTYFFKIFFFSLIEFLFESTNLTLGSQFQAHTKKWPNHLLNSKNAKLNYDQIWHFQSISVHHPSFFSAVHSFEMHLIKYLMRILIENPLPL